MNIYFYITFRSSANIWRAEKKKKITAKELEFLKEAPPYLKKILYIKNKINKNLYTMAKRMHL